MMFLIIHIGIVWFLRKAEDGWLNIGRCLLEVLRPYLLDLQGRDFMAWELPNRIEHQSLKT